MAAVSVGLAAAGSLSGTLRPAGVPSTGVTSAELRVYEGSTEILFDTAGKAVATGGARLVLDVTVASSLVIQLPGARTYRFEFVARDTTLNKLAYGSTAGMLVGIGENVTVSVPMTTVLGSAALAGSPGVKAGQELTVRLNVFAAGGTLRAPPSDFSVTYVVSGGTKVVGASGSPVESVLGVKVKAGASGTLAVTATVAGLLGTEPFGAGTLTATYSVAIATDGSVGVGADWAAPAVTITDPSPVAAGAPVMLSGTASDSVGATLVEVYDDVELVGTATLAGTAPNQTWSISWTPVTATTLTVFAYDAAGNVGESTLAVTPGAGWSGVQQFGTADNDDGRGVAVDSTGSVFVAGTGSAMLASQTSPGLPDLFARRFSPTGSATWTKAAATSGLDYGNAVALSGSTVRVAGATTGTLDGTTAGGFDALVVSYGLDGALGWIRQFGSTGDDQAYGIATDAAGNVFVVGRAQGNLGTASNFAGVFDGFLAKFTSAGTLEWATMIGTNMADEALAVAVDAAGNAYVAGYTGAALDGVTYVGGASDAFLAKYSTSGVRTWLKQLGSAADDKATGVAVTTDAVYLTGYAGASVDGRTNAGLDDVFVVKLTLDGLPGFTTMLGGLGNDRATGIAADASGNVAIAGYTDGVLATGLSNAGGNDLFVARLDSAGTVLWSRQTGTAARDEALGVATGPGNAVFVTGLTDGVLAGSSNAGLTDAFVLKYSASGALQ